MSMPLLNIWVLGVSVFVIISIGFVTLLWCAHFYTYPSKEQRPNKKKHKKGIIERNFRECSFFKVIYSGFKIYTAEEGEPLGEARPLRGFILACGISFLILLEFSLILWGLGKVYRYTQDIVIWEYSVFLGLVGSIVFPYKFCEHAFLPDWVYKGFPAEAAETPMSEGFLISIYGSAAILKYTSTIDIFKWIGFENTYILLIPYIWFSTVAAVTATILRPVPLGRGTWFVFAYSWVFSVAACWILGLFLII